MLLKFASKSLLINFQVVGREAIPWQQLIFALIIKFRNDKLIDNSCLLYIHSSKKLASFSTLVVFVLVIIKSMIYGKNYIITYLNI